MDVKKEIIRRTTPYKGEIDYIVDDQSTKDIINAMLESHGLDDKDYNKICALFDADSAEEVGYNIWIFLRENVDYVVETESLQTVRSPGALMATANSWGADCKNYSLFTGGVIDALNRKGAGIPWAYRFASYKWLKKDPYHVFVVMYPGTTDEIWIDAVLPYFDYHKMPAHFKDKKIMGLARVSGMQTGRPPRYIVGLNGRVRMAGDGDDDGEDDFTYDGESDPIDGSTDVADQSSGFDLSSGSGAAAASQAAPDLGSLVNPSTGATAATPGQLDPELDQTAGNYYNPDLGDTDQQAANVAAASASAPSLLSRLVSAVTGGGSGGSGGTSSGGGASGSQGSQQKQPTQQQTGTGTNVYVTPAATSSNTTLYIVLGGAALIAIILLMRKK